MTTPPKSNQSINNETSSNHSNSSSSGENRSESSKKKRESHCFCFPKSTSLSLCVSFHVCVFVSRFEATSFFLFSFQDDCVEVHES